MALAADIPQQVFDLLSRSSNISFVTADQEVDSGSRLTPGQRVSAEVLSTLPNNRVQVRVGSERFNLDLPMAVRTGQTLEMTFVSGDPRPTFAIARQTSFIPPVSLSDASRLLSLLISSEQTIDPLPTLGILRTLLAEPTTDASLLGRILQQGLRESGLFYESHLARWFGGDYQLEEILREPQGRLSPRLPQTGEQADSPADELVRTSIRTGSTEVMEALFKKSGTSMAHEGIADQRTLSIVSEQLSTLQSGQLLFRGDLFPGQSLEWKVADRESGRNQSGGRERSWETSVTISLPHLGPVTALLTLDGTCVAVKVSVENSATVPVLEAGRARLAEQLEGAGLTPAEMSIGHAVA